MDLHGRTLALSFGRWGPCAKPLWYCKNAKSSCTKRSMSANLGSGWMASGTKVQQPDSKYRRNIRYLHGANCSGWSSCHSSWEEGEGKIKTLQVADWEHWLIYPFDVNKTMSNTPAATCHHGNGIPAFRRFFCRESLWSCAFRKSTSKRFQLGNAKVAALWLAHHFAELVEKRGDTWMAIENPWSVAQSRKRLVFEVEKP